MLFVLASWVSSQGRRFVSAWRRVSHRFPPAREYRPDVVLLDIGLPGMDGYEICRAFRTDELFKHTPIIAQSGRGQSRDKALAVEAGFNYHLTKPVPLDDLERILADIAV
jgi:CheY-like chemotaxis protein